MEDNNIHQPPQPEGSAPETPSPETASPETAETSTRHNWGATILGGGFLQSKRVRRLIPLILLCVLYALVLVWARYQVETLTKQKIELQDRINNLRETRIEQQKHYQETIKISQIAERLDSTGIGITAGPPFEICLSEE